MQHTEFLSEGVSCDAAKVGNVSALQPNDEYPVELLALPFMTREQMFDPLAHRPTMPEVPEPKLEDLRPFLDELEISSQYWS